MRPISGESVTESRMEYRENLSPAQPESPTRSLTRTAVLGFLVIGVSVGFALGLFFASSFGWNNGGNTALYDEDVVTDIFDRASPAVVEITVTRTVRGVRLPGSGIGSGFLIDREGHIVTNNHVIAGATEIAVTLSDGSEVTAQKLGTSPADDLAMIKVPASEVKGIKPLELADSSKVRPGQLAVAIGSPFRQFNSITVGIVSGTGRGPSSVLLRPIPDMIQTDAPLNPGNSGGPLVNLDGEVIGVASSVRTSGLGNQLEQFRIGFAVPSNTVKGLLPELVKPTELKRPWIGIQGTAVTKDLSDQRGFPRGVIITGVLKSSPADRVGLDPFRTRTGGDSGDIITAIDGVPVGSVEEMVSYLNSKRPGDRVKLSVYRDSRTIEVPVILDPWPDT
ncbi:MAG TPA: PDZ domain-containing protein [Acidobacteria bacterium]|nr:PDZ domain-containing protein [Acidobacteriota bacterium]